VVSALDFLAEYLAVDRSDIEVLAESLRADGCPDDDVAAQVRDILDPRSERTVTEWYSGGGTAEDDERFTVRRQPPGWSTRG
jgi:hypothetical protein